MDVSDARIDTRRMTSSVRDIYLERVDTTSNLARFYVVEIQQDLFGETLIVRRWGRIGTHGRQLASRTPSLVEAIKQFERWSSAKARRGYRQL